MTHVRIRPFALIAVSAVLHFWLASVAVADTALHTGSDACDRYEDGRNAYLMRASVGMDRALETMAHQRNVPVATAAFYWGGILLQSDDNASLRSLAQLTLATYRWDGHEARAERAMARIFDEHGGGFAGLLTGLMLTDDLGPRDTIRARSYLLDAARVGNQDAGAFLRLHDACYDRVFALQ
ncbi:MAG: hypothetical protein P8J78_08420 [Maricaulis sp.]|nr:hypothetical protein [Maricaulis sp.]MDG2044620.1 hypothetical protein [Maricaulis sp.]